MDGINQIETEIGFWSRPYTCVHKFTEYFPIPKELLSVPKIFYHFWWCFGKLQCRLILATPQVHQNPPPGFGLILVDSVLYMCSPANRAWRHVYQIHQTPPAAFVRLRTVYSQAVDALHLLLYQIHQTPPAAFVGLRTVYSQAVDALHLLLYQFRQSPMIEWLCLVHANWFWWILESF